MEMAGVICNSSSFALHYLVKYLVYFFKRRLNHFIEVIGLVNVDVQWGNLSVSDGQWGNDIKFKDLWLWSWQPNWPSLNSLRTRLTLIPKQFKNVLNVGLNIMLYKKNDFSWPISFPRFNSVFSCSSWMSIVFLSYEKWCIRNEWRREVRGR